jgi:hypothetical protein
LLNLIARTVVTGMADTTLKKCKTCSPEAKWCKGFTSKMNIATVAAVCPDETRQYVLAVQEKKSRRSVIHHEKV